MTVLSKALLFNDLANVRNIFYPFWGCEAAYIHDDNFL